MSPSRYVRLPTPRRGGADEGAPLPPKHLRFMGETDESFVALGDQLVDLLTEYAGLCADSRILDIGCGYGRLPHALRRREFAGTYLGIEVLKPQVRWCRRRLGGDGFQFRRLDIANDRYNPDGKMAVRDLDLGDARFDVIAAFSVFTHMWPEDVAEYLRIISRSLAMDGRAAATFFLLDNEWHKLANADRAALKMPFEYEEGAATSRRTIPFIGSLTRPTG